MPVPTRLSTQKEANLFSCSLNKKNKTKHKTTEREKKIRGQK